MLFPRAPIQYTRVVLSFDLADLIVAALGGLVTLTTSAALWKGLAAGPWSVGSSDYLSPSSVPGLLRRCSGRRSKTPAE